jgi:hypothetical protein
MNETDIEIRIRATLEAVAAATPTRSLPAYEAAPTRSRSAVVWAMAGFAAAVVAGSGLYLWLGADTTPSGLGAGEACVEAPPDHSWHFEGGGPADIDPTLLYLPTFLPDGYELDYAWSTDGQFCGRADGPDGKRLLPSQNWYAIDSIENPPGDLDIKLQIHVYYGSSDDWRIDPTDPSPGAPYETVLVNGNEGRYLAWEDGQDVEWQIAPYVVAFVHVQAPGEITKAELMRVAESLVRADPNIELPPRPPS